MDAPTKAATDANVLHGGKIIAAIKKAGVEYVLSVPDLHTSQGADRADVGAVFATGEAADLCRSRLS
jgi:hypothetical protein